MSSSRNDLLTVDQGPHFGPAVHGDPARHLINRIRIGR